MEYVKKRQKLTGFLFEAALPNEYLVPIGSRKGRPVLGGRRFRWFGFRKFLRIPASIQTLQFATDNANVDFQGLGIEGFANWQINVENPATAIATLDLFDEDNPMARTNEELQLICVEAVRHVIANMTIAEAHRKKEDIAQELKRQLQQIESRWGIVFHHVGIRHVKVMSASVFNDLQAEYRNQLRLNSAKTRISTDRQIAAEENQQREETGMGALATDRKLGTADLENKTFLRQADLNAQQDLARKENELSLTRMDLEAALKRDHEIPLIEVQTRLAELRKYLEQHQLETQRLRREIEQTYSDPAIAAKLLDLLPEIAASLKIEHYTVMDGSGVSPVSRLVSEVMTILRQHKDILSSTPRDS